MRLRRIDIKHNCVDAGFALPTNMVDLVEVSWPGKVEGKIITMTKVVRGDLHVITGKKGKVVNEKPQLKRKISSLLSYRWFPDNRKLMARDGRGVNKAGTKLPSNSVSSLGQNSSSGASRKSLDIHVL
jgi:signal peptidase I